RCPGNRWLHHHFRALGRSRRPGHTPARGVFRSHPVAQPDPRGCRLKPSTGVLPMPRPDYSARDKAVKHNVYASVRRRDGLSHERFGNYWRDVHSTLCSRLPGLGFYVQQHFDREGGANLWPIAAGVRRIDAVLDGSAELGFASAQDQAVFAEAGKILYEDERNLFGEAIAYFLPTGSTTLVDREADGQRNGAARLPRVHVYRWWRPGNIPPQWLPDSSVDLASMDAVQKWKLHL